jgi:hypothetical protein
LVDLFEYKMMHGLTNPKFVIIVVKNILVWGWPVGEHVIKNAV